MALTSSGKRVRFDIRDRTFSGIASEYRDALRQAERLWRRLGQRNVERSPATKDRVLRGLAILEGRLNRARAALFEHTKRIAQDPMRTHVKGLDLVDRDQRGVA
jgi:hypothetical protein